MKNLLLTDNTSLKVSLGVFYLFLLFLLSVILVIGIKAVFNFIKDTFFEEEPIKKPRPKKKKKQVNSIEINPEEDTRIIFKKPS